jgi:hypothetical protein
MPRLTPTEVLFAYHSSANMMAINLLAKCLVANGSLRTGQFEEALRSTISREGAQTDRADYQWFAALLKMLEQDPNDVPKLN